MHAIQPIPTTRENLIAFRISGRVEKDDMHGMAEIANAAFDSHGTVDMLLIFENFEGSDAGAMFDGEAMKAQFRSLVKVGRYVVVGAPESAESMIQTMDAVIPVEAMTFDKGDEEKAWIELGARPA
jgi:hypothetical protein